MKIIIGIFFLFLCTFIGYNLSLKYTKRKIFYGNFFNFNEKLLREVSFLQTTIVSLLNDIDINTDFYDSLKHYVNTKEFKFDKQYLLEEEKNELNRYFKTIGTSDKIGQLEYLSSMDITLKNKRIQTEENEKKYRMLYIKMGFLIGLIILIILL